MPTRITFHSALSLCLVLVTFSITLRAQNPSGIDRLRPSRTDRLELMNRKTLLISRDDSEVVSRGDSDQEKPQNFKFDGEDFKDVINKLGELLKLNIVFDDQVKSGDKVNVELRDVTAEKAMKIVLIQKRYQARIIEENTLIIFPDNQFNLKRYEQYQLWPPKKVSQSPSRTDSSPVRDIVQDIRFRDVTVKATLGTFGASSGLNVVLDDTVANFQKVTITLKDVTMESALETVLIQQDLLARRIDDQTIIVFSDKPWVVQRFAEYKPWPEKRDLAFAEDASRPQEKTKNFAFHDEELNSALSTLCTGLKLNVVFHHQIKTDDKVTIDLQDVTTEQAVENILNQKKYLARRVEKNTIMVFPDNVSSRQRSAEYKPWPSITGEHR